MYHNQLLGNLSSVQPAVRCEKGRGGTGVPQPAAGEPGSALGGVQLLPAAHHRFGRRCVFGCGPAPYPARYESCIETIVTAFLFVPPSLHLLIPYVFYFLAFPFVQNVRVGGGLLWAVACGPAPYPARYEFCNELSAYIWFSLSPSLHVLSCFVACNIVFGYRLCVPFFSLFFWSPFFGGVVFVGVGSPRIRLGANPETFVPAFQFSLPPSTSPP